QGIMPLLGGALAGGIFADAISKYSGITVFLILGIIGGKMVKEGYSKQNSENT
ncbi:MAG: manganese efflux pump, partial [Peptostreptococcaceae bacterium]|nr:manganese efflux pump [Peptostreptococcaceae bacterium]